MHVILVVCTANICRSPMAEVLLRAKLADKQPAAEWVVRSAGTWGQAGLPAAGNAVKTLEAYALDLTEHRAVVVDEELITSADLVLTMEAGQKEALRIEFPDKSEQIWMLSEMVGQRYEIEDPIGQPLDKFQQTAELLDDILERGLEQIIDRAAAV